MPTDRFAIQDMYLIRIHQMAALFEKIMRADYRGTVDVHALTEFFALCNSFYWFAKANIKKHCTPTEAARIAGYFEGESRLSAKGILGRKGIVPVAMELYQLFQDFAYKSKLTDLSAKRWKGEFSRARERLGIDRAASDAGEQE